MVPTLEWFIAKTFKQLEPPTRVRFGDESFAEATGVGEVQLLSIVKGNKFLLTLTNVLYVPSFQVSLVSVHQLAKNGNFTSIFGQTGGHVLDREGQVVLEVTHDLGLYHIAAEPVVQSEHA
ncbi:hypothetical protein B0H10DRAFT_1743289, partial [Mycena sp. CBHHK59/15]